MPDQSYLDTVMQAVQEPEVRALLDTLSGPESAGKYNVRFNGWTPATFDDYSQHPNQAVLIPPDWPGPGAGTLKSTAAGRYQMIEPTYRAAAVRLGLPGAATGNAPFDPPFQDMAAYDVANQAYKQVYPQADFLTDLKNGKIDQIASALRQTNQWTTANPNTYFANLANVLQADAAATSDRTQGEPSTQIASVVPMGVQQLASVPTNVGGP